MIIYDYIALLIITEKEILINVTYREREIIRVLKPAIYDSKDRIQQ